jgi:hypothetical protein
MTGVFSGKHAPDLIGGSNPVFRPRMRQRKDADNAKMLERLLFPADVKPL